MNANWNLPTLTSTYANFLAEMKSRDEDIATWFDGTTSTNLVNGTKRWNGTGAKFEKWTGTAWSDLSTLYEMKVRDSDKLNGQTATYYAVASHTHAVATTTAIGFMSYSDKAKLDGLDNANILSKIPKIPTPTTNAIPKINADGTLANSSITIDSNNNIGSGTQTFNGFGGTGFKNKFINSTKNINTRGTTNNDNSYNYDMHYKVGNNWFRPIEGINIRSAKTHTISWDGAATCSYYIGSATSFTINAQTFIPIAKGATITPTITTGQNIWFKFASDATGSTYLNEQFEEGTIATPFEFRPYGLELSLSQRYFEKVDSARCNTIVYGTGTGFIGSIKYKVKKRITPTISFGTVSHWRTIGIYPGYILSTLNAQEITTDSFDINGTSSAGNIPAGYAGKIQVNDGYIDNGIDGIFVYAEL